MTNWKYTDSTNTIAERDLDDGRTSSVLASSLPEGTVIDAATPVPLDELKTLRKDYVNIQRDLALYGGIEYDGNNYDSTQDSRAAISAEYNGVNNGYILPIDFIWRTSDNTNIPFSEADVNNLGHLMLDHGYEQMLKSWALKKDIDDLDENSTEEDVNAIVW